MHNGRACIDGGRVLVRSCSSELVWLVHAHVGILELLRQTLDVPVGHGTAGWLEIVRCPVLVILVASV